MPALIILTPHAHDVMRRAQRDGRSPVTGRALVGEHAGDAIALTSGRVLAGPSSTSAAVRRLRRRRSEPLRRSGDVTPILRRLVAPVAVQGA